MALIIKSDVFAEQEMDTHINSSSAEFRQRGLVRGLPSEAESRLFKQQRLRNGLHAPQILVLRPRHRQEKELHFST